MESNLMKVRSDRGALCVSHHLSYFFFWMICFVGMSSLGFIYLVVYFDWTGSSLLRLGFLWLWPVGATVLCGAQASHCSGFSGRGAGALECRLRS